LVCITYGSTNKNTNTSKIKKEKLNVSLLGTRNIR
jgi:hypothetical protein